MFQLTVRRVEALRDEEISALVSTLSQLRGEFLTRLCYEMQRALLLQNPGHMSIATHDAGEGIANLSYDSERMIAMIQSHLPAVQSRDVAL